MSTDKHGRWWADFPTEYAEAVRKAGDLIVDDEPNYYYGCGEGGEVLDLSALEQFWAFQAEETKLFYECFPEVTDDPPAAPVSVTDKR